MKSPPPARAKRVACVLVILVALAFPSASAAGELPEGDWVAKGFSAESREALQTHMTRSVERGELPGGSLLLMHEGEVIFDQGFGYTHIRRKSPFTADAPVRVASLSKSIIATLIVRLDARRALDLDRPIDGYLARLLQLRLTTGEAPKRMPTLRECLKHTAGFVSDYESGGRPWLEHYNRVKPHGSLSGKTPYERLRAGL